MDLHRLEELAYKSGLDPVIVAICLWMYRQCRHITFGQWATRGRFALLGLPAGCAFALLMVKVYMMGESGFVCGYFPRYAFLFLRG